ncbi:MAG: hypothetical protein JSS09_06160 [Verrucomicrobia bacterium]|nr:hypothetical protein [Verrucomicrobiota bacterium]
MYYGFRDEDSECQKGTRGGLNLSDWLKGFGLEKVALNCSLLMLSLLMIITERVEFFSSMIGIVIADSVFNVMWFIWGVVILATKENNSCVAESEDIAVMTIVNLVLNPFWFIQVAVLKKKNSQ